MQITQAPALTSHLVHDAPWTILLLIILALLSTFEAHTSTGYRICRARPILLDIESASSSIHIPGICLQPACQILCRNIEGASRNVTLVRARHRLPRYVVLHQFCSSPFCLQRTAAIGALLLSTSTRRANEIGTATCIIGDGSAIYNIVNATCLNVAYLLVRRATLVCTEKRGIVVVHRW